MSDALVRLLPDQGARVETGPTQFGADWPGIFIRGDSALYFAHTLRLHLANPTSSPISKAVLEGLAKTLEACHIGKVEAADGSLPPVDRSHRVMTDGSPVTEDHRELRPDGQQKGYVVLSEEERAKGFQRPVRRSYRHLKCDAVTTMSQEIAETYARDPGFYSGTFCVACRAHFPVGTDGEFVWEGTEEKVGT